MCQKIAISLILLGLFAPCPLISQGEANNWYFGNGAGLHFNRDGSVTAITDGQLQTFEGCATLSDNTGKLLFYTDGITVFDRDHEIMENGNGLYGDSSSTQSALIVPKPNDPNIYYIFTVDTSTFEEDPNFGLNYSIVDMSKNGGKGAISVKNTRLLNRCSEKIAAVVKDCSDKSIWVVTLATQGGAEGKFDTFHAYEVNSDGVINIAVKSPFPGFGAEDQRGYLKFSADGTKAASANSVSGLVLYDFDAATGIFRNPRNIAMPRGVPPNPYGVEFSPNGRFLYIHTSNDVLARTGSSSALIQFDLQEGNLSDSAVILDRHFDFRAALQLGPNGRIYRTIARSYTTGTNYLGVINNPNRKGEEANYVHNAINLKGKYATQGLPPFIQSFFNKIDLIQNEDGTTSGSLTLCEGDSFLLDAGNIEGATYNWEKDGESFVNPNRDKLDFSASELGDSGLYRVVITSPDPMDCPIIGESLIEIHEVPDGQDLVLEQCDVDSGNSSDGITVTDLEQVFSGKAFNYQFFETQQDFIDGKPIANPESYINSTPFSQTLFYSVINEIGCGDEGKLQLNIRSVDIDGSIPKVFYGCADPSSDGMLTANYDLDEITSQNYPASDVRYYISLEDAALEKNPLPSVYSTGASNIYARIEKKNQCEDVQTVELRIYPTPEIYLEDSYLLCTDNPNLYLKAPEGFDTYKWFKNNPGGTVEISQEPELAIRDTGEYTLEVAYKYDNGGQETFCYQSAEFNVSPSNIASITQIKVEDASQNNNIEIMVSGDGDYEYAIANGPFQDSPRFENVPAGFVNVIIRDKNGCGSVEEEVSVIGFPKFFTPNGDGNNDSWYIYGTNEQFQADSQINIFDRFGRMITQISPTSGAWDGTFNGRDLPASDYWFHVMLEDGRQFKGHFTLKR